MTGTGSLGSKYIGHPIIKVTLFTMYKEVHQGMV